MNVQHVFLCCLFSGLQTEGQLSGAGDVRLVEGKDRCAGVLEMNKWGKWGHVVDWNWNWNLKSAALVCRQLDCGSAVSTEIRNTSSNRLVWGVSSLCLGSTLIDCTSKVVPFFSTSSLHITCSDLFRLVGGNSLCSGRLEVKNQSWSTICEGYFDQEFANMVCMKLECGAPPLLPLALSAEEEAPIWTSEFQSEGNESVLLDSTINTCSPGTAVVIPCSEPDDVRLVGGASRCAGELEMKQNGEWKPVAEFKSDWQSSSSAVVCRQLDCGSAVHSESRESSSKRSAWWISGSCQALSDFTLRECVSTAPWVTSSSLHITCSGNTGKAVTTNPTSINSISTATPSPLLCVNGGQLLAGVCICPDEWTGEMCSAGDFCQAKEINGFRFPRTPVGWFGHSEQVCPKGTNRAGTPQASSRCSKHRGLQSFAEPQMIQCDLTLGDIQQQLTRQADLQMLAARTQILTSRPDKLTADDVTTAVKIVNSLLLSPNATESVRVAAIATVSQLMDASAPPVPGNHSLTETLEKLSVTMSPSQVVQPNLVLQSAQIPAGNTMGVQFASLKGATGSFVADRIQLNTNASGIVVENGFQADVLIFIRFPPAVARQRKPSNVSLGFVLYQNDGLFRSRLYRKQPSTSIRVLSARFSGHRARTMGPQSVEMMFTPTIVANTKLYDYACVFWDYSLGDWSTRGCTKGNASDGVLRCFCSHTTNFAALMTFKENYKYAEALSYISIIGLSFSIIGLTITIIHRITESFQKKGQQGHNSTIVQVSICISLLIFSIIFLSGVNNPNEEEEATNTGPHGYLANSQTNTIPESDMHVEPDHGPCTAVTALLHYFLLATFVWNAVFGTQLVFLIHSMQRGLPRSFTFLSITIGWGVPAVIVAVTLGVAYRVNTPLGYRREEFCWLAAVDSKGRFDFRKPMFWGFALPVGLVLIYNAVLLCVFALKICRTNPNLNSTRPTSLGKKFLTSFSVAVLLGLSWILGYLVLSTSNEQGVVHLIFSIVFCLCTTTQGLQIFIFFTARTPSFKKAVCRPFRQFTSASAKRKSRERKDDATGSTGISLTQTNSQDTRAGSAGVAWSGSS